MIGSRAPMITPYEAHKLAPGDYAKDDQGDWYACSPNGALCWLRNHSVTEHEDGTITVRPSILVTSTVNGQDKELFHGYLERGIWRSC